jgi:hypothetical protein
MFWSLSIHCLTMLMHMTAGGSAFRATNNLSTKSYKVH